MRALHDKYQQRSLLDDEATQRIEKYFPHLSACYGDVPGVVIYQDDILIHAPSSDVLVKRVSNVMTRLEQKNVTVNPEKSVFFTDKVTFLGHVIDQDGIHADPSITLPKYSHANHHGIALNFT